MLLILIMPIILPFSRTGAFLIWFSVRIWQTSPNSISAPTEMTCFFAISLTRIAMSSFVRSSKFGSSCKAEALINSGSTSAGVNRRSTKEADQVLAAICDRHAADFLFCDEVQSIADRGFFGNGINLLLHDGKQRRLRCFFFRNTENRVSLCTAFFCNPAQLHADQNGGGNRTDADTAERM